MSDSAAAKKIGDLFRNATLETAADALRRAERLAAMLKPDHPARQYVEGLRMLASIPRK